MSYLRQSKHSRYLLDCSPDGMYQSIRYLADNLWYQYLYQWGLQKEMPFQERHLTEAGQTFGFLLLVQQGQQDHCLVLVADHLRWTADADWTAAWV